jgi:hypothetical protein
MTSTRFAIVDCMSLLSGLSTVESSALFLLIIVGNFLAVELVIFRISRRLPQNLIKLFRACRLDLMVAGVTDCFRKPILGTKTLCFFTLRCVLSVSLLN